MESIERNVSDIAAAERQVYESVLGHKLQDDQRVIIQVADAAANGLESPKPQASANIDDWAIFKDLNDEEIAELEAAILDRSEGREFDI
jgi:hypothetical protein